MSSQMWKAATAPIQIINKFVNYNVSIYVQMCGLYVMAHVHMTLSLFCCMVAQIIFDFHLPLWKKLQ